MAEEFKTTGEPLGQDKIGTKVTWHGKDSDPEVDVVYGVAIKRGESVDFAEHMGEEQAKRFARKLAANPDFQVEGAPRAKPTQPSALADPTALRSAAAQVTGARLLAERQGNEPPEGYDAPMQAVLESQNAAKQQAQQNTQGGGDEAPASRRAPTPKGR